MFLSPLIPYLFAAAALIADMAFQNSTSILLFLLSTILLLAFPISGFGAEGTVTRSHPHYNLLPLNKLLPSQGSNKEELWRWRGETGRRLMIGSTAPTCTYNIECRRCRFRCSAEQVPVDANDPINSAYHYRCVCHI